MLLVVKLRLAAVLELDLGLIIVPRTIRLSPQFAAADKLTAAYCRLLPNFVIPSLHGGLTFFVVEH